MKTSYKILALALSTALPLVASSAQAAETVKKTTTMSDGTQVTVSQTTDVNAAADPMTIKYTSYSYDVNKNGIIDNDEVISYVTRYADTNNDGYIDTKEYEDNSMMYFYNMMEADAEAADKKTYSFWDKDKDNRLDSSEVETLVENVGLYKKWDYDHDGKIDSSEFAKATFKTYDKDNNGAISMEEWADVVM